MLSALRTESWAIARSIYYFINLDVQKLSCFEYGRCSKAYIPMSKGSKDEQGGEHLFTG